MKFIVKRDFYRTPDLADVSIVDACKGAAKEAPHPNHFHQGAIIEIGNSANESELQTSNKDGKPVKKLIATLRYAGCIGDAADKDVVSRVVGDVDTAAKKAASAKKQDEAASAANAGNVLTELLQKLLAEKAPAR